MAILEAVDLVKNYGKIEALKGVTLRVEEGQIFGLLGRNGAGKTTFVKIMLSLVRRTTGSAKLLGHDVGSVAARRQVGYLPEDHRMPEYHTPRTLLECSGLIYGLSAAERRQRIPQLVKIVGLEQWVDVKAKKFSKGMKQRLGLAQALLHEPRVLFLDEPTDGVDPVGRHEIRALILKLKERGKTVFINSHLLSEVEQTCDRVAIIESGKLVREGTIADLTRMRNEYAMKLAGDLSPHMTEFAKLTSAARLVDGGVEFTVNDPKELDVVIDFVRGKQIGIRGLQEKTVSLEDVFLRTIKEKQA